MRSFLRTVFGVYSQAPATLARFLAEQYEPSPHNGHIDTLIEIVINEKHHIYCRSVRALYIIVPPKHINVFEKAQCLGFVEGIGPSTRTLAPCVFVGFVCCTTIGNNHVRVLCLGGREEILRPISLLLKRRWRMGRRLP